MIQAAVRPASALRVLMEEGDHGLIELWMLPLQDGWLLEKVLYCDCEEFGSIPAGVRVQQRTLVPWILPTLLLALLLRYIYIVTRRRFQRSTG